LVLCEPGNKKTARQVKLNSVSLLTLIAARPAALAALMAALLVTACTSSASTPSLTATAPVVLTENPCGYMEPEPTPVPPDQTPTPHPTVAPPPFGDIPTPSRNIVVPPYPDLPLAAPDTLLWLDAVVALSLTFEDRSSDTVQGLVVDSKGLVLTSLNPRYTIASIHVTTRDATRPAELLRYDSRTNVALVRVDASGLVAAPHAFAEVQPGEPSFALLRSAEGTLTRMPVFVSPSVNAPDTLAALLSDRSRTVAAGVTITDRDGRPIGITQRAGWQWTGTSIHTGGPLPGPDQPIVLLDSALALLDGRPREAAAIPAAVAYHGGTWGRLADGPITRELIADEVSEVLRQVGEPVALEDLGQRPRRVLGQQRGTFLELLYAEPQRLRSPGGDVVGQGRYIALWWRRDAGLPDLLLCGETSHRLGAAFAMPHLGHLEAVMERAPGSSRSVVQAAPLPIDDEDFRSYPYTWTFAADQQTYAPGEPVRFTVAVTNASEFSMPLDFTPPMVLIHGIGASRDVALLPHGDDHQSLSPGETATFDITWDARTAWGNQAPTGDYQAQALIANSQEFSTLGVTGPRVRFAVAAEQSRASQIATQETLRDEDDK
jgi:hypothetical protein